MATLASLIVNVEANTVKLAAGMEKTQQQIEGVASAAVKAGKLIASAFVVTEVIQAARSFLEFSSNITDMSQKTGIGVEALQKLKYAAEQNGGSLDKVTTSITKMGANLVTGNAGTVNALKALGLSFDDIRAMKPDDAFIKIGDAIAGVNDPMAQAALATAIFGKAGADNLPMFTGHLKETADHAEKLGLILSTDVIKAGDDFGDTLSSLLTAGMALLGKVLGPFLPILQLVADAALKVAGVLGPILGGTIEVLVAVGAKAVDWLVDMGQKFLDWVSKIPGVSRAIEAMRSGFNTLKDGAIALHDKLVGVKGASADAGSAFDKLAANGRPLLDLHDKGALAAQKHAEALARMPPVVAGISEEFARGLKPVVDYNDAAHKLGDELAGWAKIDAGLAMIEGVNVALEHGVPLARMSDEAIHRIHESLGQAIETYQRLGLVAPAAMNELYGATARMPAVLAGIAAGATFGDQIVDQAERATQAVVTLGTALKTKLHDVLLSIPQTVASSLTGGGGISGAVKAVASGVGSAVGGSIGLAIGGPMGAAIGSALGSLAGPLVGTIGKWLGIGATEYEKRMKAAAQETMKLQQQLVSSHGGMAQLIIDADLVGINIKEAFNWKDPEAFKNVVSDLDQKTQLLNSAMQEYGFTWEDLGEKARGAKLEQLFDDLFAKTQILEGAGINHDEILRRQADDYSHLVQQAIRSGTEIPRSMEPVLTQLYKMGLLVDQNGDKFDNLSDIHWATTLTEGFGQVTDAIHELTDAITRGVGSALDDIGRKVVHPRIEPVYPESSNDVSTAATGGIVGNGRVLRFRRGGFVPSGTDTVPAMLTPGEIVLNAAQQRNLARAIGGGDDPPVIHVYIGNEELDGRIVKVARKDAAKGGTRQRATVGRSY